MGRKIALDKLTFISGGQTGIDRAVLDFCLDHQLSCGGWCPEGRLAEDGPIDRKYPLKELPGASYEDRTMANVTDSDATVILYLGKMSGGTQRSFEFASRQGRPCLPINFEELPPKEAAIMFLEFIDRLEPAVVNFSGPRQSEWRRAYESCIDFLNTVLNHQ
jgi:hypothetical protein